MSLIASILASLMFAAAPSWYDRVPLTIPQITSGKYDYKPAYLTGTIDDVLDDTTDPEHIFLIVREGSDSILVPVRNAKQQYRELRALIGARATFEGNCDAYVQERIRRHIGRRFNVGGFDRIRVLTPPADLFLAPDILELDAASPADIAQARRHKANGRVIAVWGQNQVLITTASNRLVRVSLADPTPPAAGDAIEAVGFPETDLSHINLTRAVWRKTVSELTEPMPDSIREMTIRELLEDDGVAVFPLRQYGSLLRLRGTVKNLPRNGVLQLEDESYILPVDVSSVKNLPEGFETGCRIEVLGVYIVQADSWRPNAPFPQVHGSTLIVRSADDVRILARPPWWTVGRLFAVIGTLAAALIGILIWNRALRILAERRGRQLYREQIQSVKSELKFLERTNLAVELHDAISQYLTGIALELRTVETVAKDIGESARHHLSVASRTLASCRDELRNCLWDLRNNTLEQHDLAAAIRTTLTPHIGSARLAVRFEVARAVLSEKIVHAVLQIARELAVNAVRHGHATEIRIVGKIEDDKLRFSVRDNGSGFVPDEAPGMEEGHFGLLGVRERVEKFEGSLEIESSPGSGARFIVLLTIGKEAS